MSRLPYVKPTILQHVNSLANKFGRGPSRRSLERIDGVAVAELIERFGSPLFVFSEHRLRQRYQEAYRAFSLRYPRVQLAWSYKTNYLDAVCRVFHEEGAWAEVVSEIEYAMARANGIPPEHILFNGPYKPPAALREALLEGARVHIDHYDELYAVEQIAREAGQRLGVTLRVNMDTGIQPRWDRFGFNLDSGEAMDAIRRLHAGGHLELHGLHAHIGTFVLDPQAHGRAAAKLGALALQVRAELGVPVRYLDLGGGFASRATLHAQYAPGRDATPPIEDYAESITSALLSVGFAEGELPLLMLETGRALVDEAGFMVTRVVGNKRLANGGRAVIIDAGLNVLFTSLWYRHEVLPVVDRGGMLEDAVVYGPLCMNIDVVRPSVSLPPLEVGDALVVRPVGAYNLTQSMQFIRLRPAAVLIGADGSVEVIRRAEELDDVKRAERLPAWRSSPSISRRCGIARPTSRRWPTRCSQTSRATSDGARSRCPPPPPRASSGAPGEATSAACETPWTAPASSPMGTGSSPWILPRLPGPRRPPRRGPRPSRRWSVGRSPPPSPPWAATAARPPSASISACAPSTRSSSATGCLDLDGNASEWHLPATPPD